MENRGKPAVFTGEVLMPKAATAAAPPQKLAYKLKEVADITSIGYDRLRAHIDSGALRAKRYEGADGNLVGPFLVRHADLENFLDSLPDA